MGGGSVLFFCFFFFWKYKEISKKVFPRVSTRNNVPEKKSLTAAYVQRSVRDLENLPPPFRLILYTHKTQKHGRKP